MNENSLIPSFVHHLLWFYALSTLLESSYKSQVELRYKLPFVTNHAMYAARTKIFECDMCFFEKMRWGTSL